MKQKKFYTMGVIVGAVLVVCGLLVMFGVFGGSDVVSGAPTSSSYDMGYAKFGADFYNYVSNNAARAAASATVAASNTAATATLVKNVGGIIIIALGLITICAFGALSEKAKGALAAAGAPMQTVGIVAPETKNEIPQTDTAVTTPSVNITE